MAVEVIAALQAFKTIFDTLKAMSDTRDETLRSNTAIELTRQIIELQGQVVAALQENATLAERVRTLEAEVVRLKEQGSDLARYELKEVGGGAVAYMLKPTERGSEPPHWLCPSCYAQGKKTVLALAGKIAGKTFHRCPICKVNTETPGEPRWV